MGTASGICTFFHIQVPTIIANTAIMAPGFDQLSDHDFEDEIEDIDFSDLKERYDVRMEEGLDTFVVIDGLPIVNADQKSKLVKFLLKRLNSVGRIKDGEESIFMPMNDQGMSEGFAFVEYQTPEQAVAATKQLHGVALDKRHTLAVNKLTDIEKYGREGRIDEQYVPPEIEPFSDREHLRSWLFDAAARDQFAMFRGDKVGVFWNNKKECNCGVDLPSRESGNFLILLSALSNSPQAK